MFNKDKEAFEKSPNLNCLTISKVKNSNLYLNNQIARQRFNKFISEKIIVIDNGHSKRNKSSQVKLRKFRLIERESNVISNIVNNGSMSSNGIYKFINYL